MTTILTQGGTVDVTVTLPKDSGYSVGDNIVIKDNAGNTILDRELTQQDLDNGIPVQAEVPADGKTLGVTATVTDPQGNSAEGKNDSVVGDTTAPNAPIVDILEGNDNVIDGKDLNEDGEVDVKVYLPKDAVEGDTLTVNGKEIPITKEMVDEGSYITSVLAPAEGEKLEVTATVTDEAGNVSEEGKDSAVGGDMTAPTAPTVNIVDEGGEAGQLDNEDLVNGQVQVTVDIAGTGAELGDIVTVTNPDGSTTNYPVNQDNLANGLTINYPKDQFPAGEDVTVSAVITDEAGNTSDSGSDTTTSNLVPTPPVDPETPAELNLTVDLQDFIDATKPTEVDGVEGVWATVTGTTDAEPGSEVSIVVAEYDKDGQIVGTALPAVTAIVRDDGTYEAKVNVQSLGDTDETGTARDLNTIGAVATVTDKVTGETDTAEDLLAEKASDAGLDFEEIDPEVQDVFNSLGLNNDMSLVYGPSETIILQDSIFTNRKTGFTISEETSYTDPLLFTNYDDVLVMDNTINILGNNANPPNDGGNAAFGSTDGRGSVVTVDTGQGDDLLSISGTSNPVDARIYLGEGDDTFRTTATAFVDPGYIGRNTIVYMEAGNDTVSTANDIGGSLYTGSGADTVEVNGNVSGLVDLGSGNTPEDYQSEYADGSGLSLGNDTNIDLATDKNVLNVTGNVSGTVVSGNGLDNITVGGNVTGEVYTRDGNDNVNVAGNVVNGSISTGKGEDRVIVDGNVGQTDLVETKSYVDGGVGNDYIRVKGNVTGALYQVPSVVSGGSGDDTVIIDGRVLRNAEVVGGSGEDKMYVKNLTGSQAKLSGGTDSDLIIVDTIDGGTLTTGNINKNEDNAVDTVRINNLEGGTIWLGEGDILTSGIEAFSEEDGPFAQEGPFEDAYLKGSTINYSQADDTLSLKGISSGSIDMGEGNDTIVITGDNDGINKNGNHTVIQSHNIKGGAGIDTIEVTGTGNEIWAGDLFSVEVVDLGDNGNIFKSGYIRDYNEAISQNEAILEGGEKTMFIRGGETDSVDLGYGSGRDYGDGLKANNWSQTATGVEVDGVTYNVWSQTGSAYGGPSSIYIEDTITAVI